MVRTRRATRSDRNEVDRSRERELPSRRLRALEPDELAAVAGGGRMSAIGSSTRW